MMKCIFDLPRAALGYSIRVAYGWVEAKAERPRVDMIFGFEHEKRIDGMVYTLMNIFTVVQIALSFVLLSA